MYLLGMRSGCRSIRPATDGARFAGVFGLLLATAGCGLGDSGPFSGPPRDLPPKPLEPVPLELPYSPRPEGTITWTREVAPIIYRQCASCHSEDAPDRPAPLTTWEQVRTVGEAVADSVRAGRMPPWLPEPGFTAFAGARQLTPTQVGLLLQWAEEGMAEGDPEDLLPPEDMIRAPEPPPLPDAPLALWLGHRELTVPEGGPDSPLYDRYIVPEDIFVHSVMPVVGPAGLDLQAWALRPDGSREWLLRIQQWDPARGERYHFEQPLELPFGTVLAIEFTFGDPAAATMTTGALELIATPMNAPDRAAILADADRWTTEVAPEPDLRSGTGG